MTRRPTRGYRTQTAAGFLAVRPAGRGYQTFAPEVFSMAEKSLSDVVAAAADWCQKARALCALAEEVNTRARRLRDLVTQVETSFNHLAWIKGTEEQRQELLAAAELALSDAAHVAAGGVLLGTTPPAVKAETPPPKPAPTPNLAPRK